MTYALFTSTISPQEFTTMADDPQKKPPFKTVAASTANLNATVLPEDEMPPVADETPLKEKVKEQAREIGEQATALKDQAVEGYHKMEENAEMVKQRAEDFNRRAVEFIQDNPAVTIVGAFGVGYLLGSLAARRWVV